ncbi:MAG: metal-dependent hydrolase [Desulfocapsaceae bacterium]|nr:metal-dependent hydrolase [Desulfocapsaceae bacterium]
MPTVFTHAAVPLAMSLGLGREIISKRLMAAGVVVSVLPDLDVLAFRFGIPYASAFGHRGFSHSLLFAFAVALIGASLARPLLSTARGAFFFLFLAAASHGILDSFTSGGLGIAFLWPFSDARFFAPVHPLRVCPFGLSGFLSFKGLIILWSEVRWVWLPCMGTAIALAALRRRRASLSRGDLHENGTMG